MVSGSLEKDETYEYLILLVDLSNADLSATTRNGIR